jgi:vitellogenic carboxypeptidase-like protein
LLLETSQGIQEVPRDLSWNLEYNILFIDNPIGVGYSILQSDEDIPTDDLDVAMGLLYGLTQIFAKGLQAYQNAPCYLFGRGYAGKFIPFLASKMIDDAQAAGTLTAMPIKLKGIGIGGPWTDPIRQAENYGLWSYSMGLSSEEERRHLERVSLAVILKISQRSDPKKAFVMYDDLLETMIEQGGSYLRQNYRLRDDYNYSLLDKYLNQDDVKEKYGAEQAWVRENMNIYTAFQEDFTTSRTAELANVLRHMPVLLFTGQDDPIANPIVTNGWIEKIDWDGRDAFNAIGFKPCIIDDEYVASWKSYGNLFYFVINQAGRLAPYDQMDATLNMLRLFFNQKKSLK